ncbi:MAG: hypothetical protein JW976_02655 [Syntrophaceae bacterium]|nr:hypothetical protein [Syntrophaceae bacterium]
MSNLFEPQTKANEFDRIISLGCNCELTLNIRAYFGIEYAYPFDWWITPFQALWKLLENRFHDLFNINNLEVSPDLLTVRDKYYNLLYHHDFKRTDDDKIIADDIVQQLPLVKQKYEMLIGRFFNDPQNKKVLFIRNRDGNIPHLDHDTTPMDENTFVQLYDLLEKLFPNSAISLLVTNCPLFSSIRRRNGCITWDETANYEDYLFFSGSRRGWQEMFCRNNISYKGVRVLDSVK